MEGYFEKLKESIHKLDETKDDLVRKSIRVTRLSKSAVYSLIRDDFESAEKTLSEMKELVQELKEVVSKYPQFHYNIRIALQEYAEAAILYEYLKNDRIPTHEDLGIDEISYVNGLIDFCGELFRRIVEELIKDNIDFVFKAKKTIEDIYLKMLYIEFREYELRRRVDNLQNTLNKISERILERKLARGL